MVDDFMDVTRGLFAFLPKRNRCGWASAARHGPPFVVLRDDDVVTFTLLVVN